MGTLFNLSELEKDDMPEIPVEKPAMEKPGTEKPPAETSEEKKPPEEVKPEPATPVVETQLEKPAGETNQPQKADGQGETEAESGDESDDDEAEDDEKEEADEKDIKQDPKKKENERDPYEWGKCPIEITVQIQKQDGNPNGQLVRVGTHTHTNPAEPPKITDFRTEPLPFPLPEKFWDEVREIGNAQLQEIIKEFPDRDASWKANKIHKQDPQPYVHKKNLPAASKSIKRGDSKEEKKKPPSIDEGTLNLFGAQKPEEKKG